MIRHMIVRSRGGGKTTELCREMARQLALGEEVVLLVPNMAIGSSTIKMLQSYVLLHDMKRVHVTRDLHHACRRISAKVYVDNFDLFHPSDQYDLLNNGDMIEMATATGYFSHPVTWQVRVPMPWLSLSCPPW